MVDAAYELLEEKGLEGLTIRAVLKRTGLARRAFYERFAGKDDLVLAVFEQTIRLAADHYAEQIAALPDPMERLRLILTCLAQGKGSPQDADRGQSSRRGAAMSREHLRLAESRPGDLQAAIRPLIELIGRQLGEGMKAGQVRYSDPQRLATLVYNLVSTTAHAKFLAQEVARPRRARPARMAEDVRLVEDIWEFCRRAIAASA